MDSSKLESICGTTFPFTSECQNPENWRKTGIYPYTLRLTKVPQCPVPPFQVQKRIQGLTRGWVHVFGGGQQPHASSCTGPVPVSAADPFCETHVPAWSQTSEPARCGSIKTLPSSPSRGDCKLCLLCASSHGHNGRPQSLYFHCRQ